VSDVVDGIHARLDGQIDDWQARLRPPADDAEPADSEWAEANGFRWATDGTAMLLTDGGWEVLLTGDVAECEKRRGLTLMSAPSWVGGTKVQAARVLADDPTRGEVRRLLKALGVGQ
jgi:hypothetical protein